jgi:lipoprotein signal peptidase
MQTEGRAPLSGDEPQPVQSPDLGEFVPPAPERPRRVGLLIAVAILVLVADQVSKVLVVSHMADREPIALLGGLVTITYTRNSGAAFSLGTGFTVIFTAVAVAVVVVILRTARRLRSVGWAIALGALLGGAVGNLTDRMLRDPGVGRGHVVDWIQLPHFAVFNLADSAIVCSAVAMFLLSVSGRDLEGTVHGAPGAPGAPEASEPRDVDE